MNSTFLFMVPYLVFCFGFGLCAFEIKQLTLKLLEPHIFTSWLSHNISGLILHYFKISPTRW